MLTENYNVIGIMSGTSLDGIDLAHISFQKSDERWRFSIHECETIGYSESWVGRLKAAINFSSKQLEELNFEYTALLSDSINNFIEGNNLTDLDAVCSHGHTILHQPEKGYTLQIGNLPEIARRINKTVVCDFRVGDVELGGQGAPLVPIGDRLLFSDYDYCLNLGGFSNVSFEENKKRIAFDISAVNTVLNFYVNQTGLDYDDKGRLARGGKIDDQLLQSLNFLEYYSKPYPKSLGFEFVRDRLIPLIDQFEIPIEDKLRTFTEHVAIQIAAALPLKKGTILVTGGGAYNDFLMDCLRHHLPEMEVVIPDKNVLEYKEALIFALLGVLKLREEVNVLSSVTGAISDHSSGKIYYQINNNV